MAFLYHKFNRRFLLSLILIWSAVSFWVLNPLVAARSLIAVSALLGFYFAWAEIAPLFLLIFLSFTSSYALYGYFARYDLPTWLVMLAILIIFGYLFTFTEQKIGILGNKRLIYLVLFSLIILEVFLVLSYFLINPLSQSLIISAVCYLFIGFCYSVLARRPDSKFSTYLYIAAAAVILILLTSTWSV